MSNAPSREGLSARWQRAFDWVESTLGGRIVGFERQPRWRPAWFIDLERNGEKLALYWRGDRGGQQGINQVYGLEHEAAVLRVLDAHGVPVPAVHGLCDDPRGLLLERSPGRANLATAETNAEREAVLDHYIELLARMHAIDIGAFRAQGLQQPESREALALDDLPTWEANYRALANQPDPCIEFVLGWLRRNLPPGERQPSFVAGDAGQFLFENGRVTAVLDLELAHLGDPASDLGALRCRDLTEPLGDLSRAWPRYAELSGQPLGIAAVRYHTVRFAICTPMAVAHLVAKPPPGLDLVQYAAWDVLFRRASLDGIAEAIGVELSEPRLPAPAPSPRAGAFDALEASLAPAPGEDAADFESYRASSTRRLIAWLRNGDRLGPALDARDLDEAGRLLGARPASREAADAALAERVAADDGERDGDLLRFFHARVLRDLALLAPAMREDPGVAIQRITS